MNALLLTLATLLVVAQFVLPRRLAFLSLLIAACHTPYSAALGGQFTTVRLVLLAGLMRACFSGHIRWDVRKPLDLLMGVWSLLALLSALGHETGNPLMYRCGLVLNVLGTYLYTRSYVQTRTDFEAFVQAAVAVLIPLAGMLAFEAITGSNPYHAIGTRYAAAFVRGERTRAMGPFGTPILAGTLGAVCFPLFVSLWQRNRKTAGAGIGASLVIIVTSASSGPIGTFLLGAAALLVWRWRTSLFKIKVAVVLLVCAIQMARERSLWYLISLIDFVGGSTGWHRSRLLDSATNHIGEWWFMGTDYTRHWMPYGLPSVPDHCDLTSYYVHLGVIGGLPLLITLLLILRYSFHLVGVGMREFRQKRSPDEFILWCAGCALFAHTITFFTISYFDQVYVFFYSLVAAITPLVAGIEKQRQPLKVKPKPLFPGVAIGTSPGK